MTAPHPSSWFEPLYAKAEGNPQQVPWATSKPNPRLQEWLRRNPIPTPTTEVIVEAIVIGCGLGDDAQALADGGYAVTAFDISPTAIAWCQQRFPETSVQFQVADLFKLPQNWLQNFPLVFESITIQALPLALRQTAMTQIRQLLAPQGRLLVSTYLRPDDKPPQGPPWPLTQKELAYFETLDLRQTSEQCYRKKNSAYPNRVFMEYLALS